MCPRRLSGVNRKRRALLFGVFPVSQDTGPIEAESGRWDTNRLSVSQDTGPTPSVKTGAQVFPVSQDTGPIEAPFRSCGSTRGRPKIHWSVTFRCHKTPAPLKHAFPCHLAGDDDQKTPVSCRGVGLSGVTRHRPPKKLAPVYQSGGMTILGICQRFELSGVIQDCLTGPIEAANRICSAMERPHCFRCLQDTGPIELRGRCSTRHRTSGAQGAYPFRCHKTPAPLK